MKVQQGMKRCLLEAVIALPVAGYIIGYPLFKIIQKSKAMSERWYSFVFSIVYVCGAKTLRELKGQLFSHLETAVSADEGCRERKELRILEIGPGFGGNFQYYPPNTKLTTIEIQDYLKKNLDKLREEFPNVEVVRSVIGNAENMPEIPDNSVDVVIGTLVLCCIDKPEAALAEIKRVLAPGGQFYYMETVQHPDKTFKCKVQKIYRPFWRGVTMRCRAGKFYSLTEYIFFTT